MHAVRLEALMAGVNSALNGLIKDSICMTRIITSFFLFIILAGCSGLDTKPEQFKVNISSLNILESSLMEQRYQVGLRIMNRSKEVINIDGMSFDVELNDKDFASGVSNKKFQLEPLSEKVVSVTATSTIFGLIRQVNSLQQFKSTPFKYELKGYIYTSDSLFGISFNETGEIKLNAPSSDSTNEVKSL